MTAGTTIMIAAGLTLPSLRFPYHDYDLHGDSGHQIDQERRNHVSFKSTGKRTDL